MVKKLMLAVAMVALLAAPSFAAVQNVKVGGDLKTTSVIRNNFDLGARLQSQTAQNVFVSQAALNVQADLTDNVSTNLRLVNENVWGQYSASGSSANINIDTANVTMKELLYAPLTVTIGRQQLAYGNQLLIGDGDGTTQVSSVTDITGGVNFDAIKAVLAYDPLTVDVFASKITENGAGQNDNADVDLFGVNANYKIGDKMSTVVEAYTFVKVDKSTIVGTQDTKGTYSYTPGLRVSTNPIEGLNVQLEGAYQGGNVSQDTTGTVAGKNNLAAYVLQGKLNYALPVLKDMKPVLSAGYTYFSGDKTGVPGKVTAFQPLYENQNVGRIWRTLFSRTGLGIAELAAEVSPMKDVTAKLSLYNLTSAQSTGTSISLNQPDGTGPVVATATGNRALGNELDLDLTYAYTEDVKFGVSASYFAMGKAFAAPGRDAASQLLSSVSVLF